MIIMSKTYTPELTPEVLDRLEDYADVFRDDFSHKKQAAWSGVYLQGLLHDGERKSIEPLSARVTLPPGLDVQGPRAGPPAVRQPEPLGRPGALRGAIAGTWPQTFASPEGIFVIDDTSFPKQGKHSVGVQRQYCGALGKKANCQVAPSVHYVSPKGHYPLAMRLFLPESWIEDAERLDEAGVPGGVPPGQDQGRRSPWSCSTRCAARGCRAGSSWPTPATGSRRPFRDGLAAARAELHRRRHRRDGRLHRGAAVGAAGAGRARGTGGRPRRRPRLAEGSPRPVSLKELGRRDAAAEGDLARGDQGEAVGPLRLAAGLAGRRLGHGRLRRGRADLAADRGAGRRQAEVRLQQPAGRTPAGCGRSGCGRAAGRWSRATSR